MPNSDSLSTILYNVKSVFVTVAFFPEVPFIYFSVRRDLRWGGGVLVTALQGQGRGAMADGVEALKEVVIIGEKRHLVAFLFATFLKTAGLTFRSMEFDIESTIQTYIRLHTDNVYKMCMCRVYA